MPDIPGFFFCFFFVFFFGGGGGGVACQISFFSRGSGGGVNITYWGLIDVAEKFRVAFPLGPLDRLQWKSIFKWTQNESKYPKRTRKYIICTMMKEN